MPLLVLPLKEPKMATLWLIDKAYYAQGTLWSERLTLLATEQKIGDMISFTIKGA